MPIRPDMPASEADCTSSRVAALDREADRQLALRSRRVAFAFVPVIVTLTFITDLRLVALWPTLAVAGLFTLAGALRLQLSFRFETRYPASPDRWRREFALVTLIPAAVWGVGVLPAIIVGMDVDWTFTVCMLASAGLAAGATSSISPRIRLTRLFITLVLLPSALTLAVVGHGREYGLAALLVVFWIQMQILARFFHSELWSGLRKGAELESRAEQLAAANEAARDASEAKSLFLANMSHEIRTPMNGILGLTGVVLESDLSDDQRELLTDVKTSGEALLRIVNEILDFSKIEAGRLELESVPFAVAEVVERAVKPQLVEAERRGNRLATRIADDVPPWLTGDAHRLGQVLTNLVGNAVKFTADGRIELAVTLAGMQSGVPLIALAVSDTGIGIAPEAQPNLFRAFSQADGSTTRRYGGTGLGLAISARLAGLMGGRIELVSAPGRGSTFTLVVPMAEAATPTPAIPAEKRPAVAAPAASTGVRVLLAEDNPVNAKLATRLLAKLGAETVWAEDGHRAVEAWRAGGFDLVLMDVQMPGMDGFQATSAIRRLEVRENRERTPIIALTAHAMDGYREKCLAEGMDDYLTKPLRSNELTAAVGRWSPVRA